MRWSLLYDDRYHHQVYAIEQVDVTCAFTRGHWHCDMLVLILGSMKEPICGLKLTMTARQVGLV
jgi:hypothetical protein